jgi:hypothetical protein
MSDLRSGLERESERFDLPSGALERMLERRRRKQARRQIETAVVALIVAAFGIWVAVSLGGLRKTPPTPTHPGSLLEGTWHTGRLSEHDVVTAFVAAGGTTEQGHTFFAQLGGGANRDAVITLRFQDGSFVEFESADGGPPVKGYQAPYRVSNPGVVTISSPRCTGTYSFHVAGQQLSLHVIRQCRGHDGPYNTTLFASFPLTKQG